MEFKLRLHVITGENDHTSHIDVAKAAASAGADVIQYRDKSRTQNEMLPIAREIKKISDSSGATLIINDNPEIAFAVDAGGVHLGLDDMSPDEARKILGNKIIGLSIGNLNELAGAALNNVDYIGSGPVFNTTTKADAGSPIGLSGIKEMVESSQKPVIGIGGINIKNAKKVLNAGVAGLAVSSAILKSNDMEKTIKDLRRLIWD